jgi:hypothetical protein
MFDGSEYRKVLRIRLSARARLFFHFNLYFDRVSQDQIEIDIDKPACTPTSLLGLHLPVMQPFQHAKITVIIGAFPSSGGSLPACKCRLGNPAGGCLD